MRHQSQSVVFHVLALMNTITADGKYLCVLLPLSGRSAKTASTSSPVRSLVNKAYYDCAVYEDIAVALP